MYKIIASGSDGNSVLYHNSILIDIGVPYSLIKPFENKIQIVLLTHSHKDHFNLSTLKRLANNRPSLRIGCCHWMLPLIKSDDGLFKLSKNIDVFEFGKWYDYGSFKLSTGKLYHDVSNCFYRIEKAGYKIFHATDTAHLEGITAKDYDLYAIEHNYDNETVFEKILEIEANGEFAHQRYSINSHLSEQQAKDFIFRNMKETSKVIRLHESK